MPQDKENLKLPPYNAEAEQSVIGALLIDRDAAYRVADVVDPSDFYFDEHREIIKAIFDLALEQKPIDIISVSDELKSRKKLESVGGITYLAKLADAVPNSANADYYARIVKEKSLLRQLIRIGSEISEMGFDEATDIDVLIDRAEKKIFSLSQKRTGSYFVQLRDFIPQSFNEIEERFKKKSGISGLSTGYEDIDKITGGFQKSDLIIIAARPSVGKTSLAINIAENMAIREGYAVAIFSLEMSKEQLIERMLCSEAKVNLYRLKTGYLSDRDWPKLTEAYSNLFESRIFIDDSTDITLTDIRAKARRLKIEQNIDLLIIDYLQLIRSKGRVENRVIEISNITRGLKNLARELDIPVVVLSQLSRAIDRRDDKRPMLSDLRESGSIEQDADIVMFLYRPNPEEKNLIELYVAKHRNGPTGSVSLVFVSEYTRFEQMANA